MSMREILNEEMSLGQVRWPGCLGLDHLFSSVWTTGQRAAGEIGARCREGMSSLDSRNEACLQGPSVSNSGEGCFLFSHRGLTDYIKRQFLLNSGTSTKKVPVSDNQPQLILSAQVGLFFFSLFLMIYYCQRRMAINHSNIFPLKSGATAGLFLKQIVNSKPTEFSFKKKRWQLLIYFISKVFFFFNSVSLATETSVSILLVIKAKESSCFKNNKGNFYELGNC